MKSDIYKITIPNWEKHNDKNKKGHTHFLVAKRFFDDPKIMSLTAVQKLLYLRLLAVCSDSASSSIEVHSESISSSISVRPQFIQSSLISLQSLQLLTFEKITPFINRKEKKRKEENRIEKNNEKIQNDEKIKEDLQQTSFVVTHEKNTSHLISFYCDQFFMRYETTPEIGGKSAGTFKRILKDHGFEKAKDLIESFFKMPDPFLVKAKHPISLFETKINEIKVFQETGKYTTNQESRNYDKVSTTQALLRKIDNGEL